MENIRIDIKNKLKEEFDFIHASVLNNKELSTEEIVALLHVQLGLAGQVIREERALNGDTGTYALPPYMPVK